MGKELGREAAGGIGEILRSGDRPDESSDIENRSELALAEKRLELATGRVKTIGMSVGIRISRVRGRLQLEQ